MNVTTNYNIMVPTGCDDHSNIQPEDAPTVTESLPALPASTRQGLKCLGEYLFVLYVLIKGSNEPTRE